MLQNSKMNITDNESMNNKSIPYKHPMLKYIIGNEETVAGFEKLKPMEPFSDTTLSFLNDLSGKLLKFGRIYSDVATFGFWCRRASLEKEKKKYDDIISRLGKGLVFHSTPSNVPVNFAFSFSAGLLAGNANIVRIPGKSFEQVNIICTAINELIESKHACMAPYIVFIKYPPVKEITDTFSAISNTRIIWGGDSTINEVRQSPLNPRANEITFADRHSIAIIDAEGYLALEDKAKVAQDFYNDTFFSDQNACTAPRVIIWIGEKIEQAKEQFWKNAHELAKEKYILAPIQVIGKLNALYRVASQIDVKLEKSKITSQDQIIMRIKVEKLNNLMKFKYNSGFFFEYDAIRIDEIVPLCDERCQTLTYCGVNPELIFDFIMRCRPRGIDRAVPMGKSMDFSLIWDGHDLIRELSRRITIL